MSNSPAHISASQLNLYLSCGEAYKRRYINKEIIPPGLTLIRGKSGHKALEENNRQKITTRTDLTVSDFQDITRTELENQFNGGLFLTAEEKTIGIPKLFAQNIDALAATAPKMAESAALVQPVAVESKEEITLPALGKSIVYVMDVETEDGGIVDYKFTGKKKTEKDVLADAGLTTYAMAFCAKHKRLPASISFHNFVTTAAGKASFHILPTDRTAADFKALYNRYESAIKGIESGIFQPAEIGHWRCSPRFCGYFYTCPYVNSERQAAAESEI